MAAGRRCWRGALSNTAVSAMMRAMPEQSSPPSDEGASRRGFLKTATVLIGGAIGAVLAIPIVRFVAYPVGRKVVRSAGEPIDAMAASALTPGAPPVRVELVAKNVRDAWTVASDVTVGAAWVSKTKDGKVVALSSVCPHLGCAVAFNADKKAFKCPCHKSEFDAGGKRLAGPAKRGLDPLPVEVKNGRVLITQVRYRTDTPDREPV